MQKNTSSRSRHVQSTHTKNVRSRYVKDNSRENIILLTILSAFLPPLGVLLTWRTSSRINIAVRAALSALATVSMTIIFCLLLRPGNSDSAIRPVPVVPEMAGYGVVSVDEPDIPEPTYVVPAAPDAVAPAEAPSAPEATDEPGALTPETTVYAVTNNASSYHLYEICETQMNNRALTLQQALDEGLTPCEKCVGAVG